MKVVVIGGGPAGATVAARLARAGRSVTILERDTFPRDKLCGEFLSGDVVSWLTELGVMKAIDEVSPPRISRARFTSADGGEAHIDLPTPAIGVSRRTLDHRLFAHAVACGASGVEGCEVDRIERRGVGWIVHGAGEVYEADLVIGAQGRRSRIDKKLDRAFLERRHPFVGLKRHHRGADDLVGGVEIHTFDGGYCGMSHVEGGVVNVCMLLEERVVRSIGGAEWSRVVAHLNEASAPLARRLATLEPAGEPLAVAQVPFADKTRHEDGVLFVGDAAAMIAPLAGDGQAMAIESAVLLADLVMEGGDLGPSWDRRWRRRFGVRMALARRLQTALLSPRWASRLVRTVGGVPGLGGGLLRLLRTRA